MSDLERLRAEARRLHRNATRKISRNKSKRGAEISGSRYDPRRELKNVNRYTEKQLRSYIGKLKQFNSRATQFVPGKGYKPIPRQAFSKYKQVERDFNEFQGKRFAEIEGIELPGGRGTVAQRAAMRETIHPQMADPVTNMFGKPLDRDSRSIDSLKGLNKLVASLRGRMTDSHLRKERESHKRSIEGMFAVIDNDNVRKRIDNFTNSQIDFMFSQSEIMDDLFIVYELMNRAFKEERELKPSEQGLFDTHSNALSGWVSWIEDNVE